MDFDVLGKTPLNLSCDFHDLGAQMSMRGVELSFPSPVPPRICGMYILKADMNIDYYFVFLTFSVCNLSLCESTVGIFSSITNCR